MHIFASPSLVQVLPRAMNKESVITTIPKAPHTAAGSFLRLYHGVEGDDSLRKQAAGKMNASAVAETPPVISNITPRSQVIIATGPNGKQTKNSRIIPTDLS
jgi:hypothetical protein